MTKKRTKTIRTIFLIFLILGGIGAIAYFGSGVQQTFFSFDRVNVLGEGEKLIITTSVGNEKDNIIVELDKNELNTELRGEGWEVARGTRIELDLLNSQEVFPLIKEEGEIFYQIAVEDTGKYFGPETVESLIRACKDRDVENVFEVTLKPGGFLQRPNLYCFYTNPIATRGHVSGTGIFEYDIKVSAAGDSEILTERNQVVSLADGDIRVEFEGSINAPIQIREVPYDILWVAGQFQQLVSQASISYLGRTAMENIMLSCSRDLDNRGRDFDAFFTCYRQANTELTNAVKSKNDEFAPLVVKSINLETITSNTGELRVEVEPTTYPLLRIIVDGDFIGLERLSGEPEITKCLSDISTKSGREIVEEFKVKNIGSQSGYFIFDAECDNPKINIYGTSGNVAPDAIRTMNLKVIGSSETTGVTERATCEISITDKVSGKQDTCSVNIAIEFTDVICVPNELFCSDDNTKVLMCGSFGDDFSVHKECIGTDTCGLTPEGLIDCRTVPLIDIPIIIVPDDEEIIDVDKECPFGQEWREAGDKLFGIFPGRPAGCYTAGWVYALIILGAIVIVVIFLSVKKRIQKK